MVVKLNRGSEPGLNFQKRHADSGFECSECFDKDKGLRGVAILMYRAIIMAAASCRVFVASSVLYSIAEDRERPRGPIYWADYAKLFFIRRVYTDTVQQC